MTDLTSAARPELPSGIHTSNDARARLKKRYRTERLFKLLGMSAVGIAALFLVLLLTSIVSKGLPAFTYNYLRLPLNLTAEKVNPQAPEKASYNRIIRDALAEQLPFVSGRKDKRVMNGLLSGGANVVLQREVVAGDVPLGSVAPVDVLLSDYADLYIKGMITQKQQLETQGTLSIAEEGKTYTLTSSDADFAPLTQVAVSHLNGQLEEVREQLSLRDLSRQNLVARIDQLKGSVANAAADRQEALGREIASNEKVLERLDATISGLQQKASGFEARLSPSSANQQLGDALPSYFLHVNGGVVKLTEVAGDTVKGEVLVPLSEDTEASAGSWKLVEIEVPEGSRKFSDKEIAYTDYLSEKGLITNTWNTLFFTSGASREPETAGIWGAVVGTFWTMLVTLALSFPIGVAAAIYLEEFAPKNRLTRLIEVNINNLAAVPSIVFGLLGLAVFLSVFGLPRSAPLVGGMVLALMTLPTIIIASRAALQAVPPSIREAALGVGASRLQTVFHHVLPLAMPGILTGTIIGMAQALGETAPLLMIGMVAFIVDIPGGPFDPSTVLPVQIFMWADFPEPAFQQKTSAAIMVLLGFLIAMNAIAIVLRKKFERRW
ncbi:phosphate ABC transporter permease PstA [Rhodobacteraceae bacterium RKSG542]|nr:phosphate ABC transporter permease PstA [Pseudovibrio flavus]